MSKITPQARAAALYLVKEWPYTIPLTRRLLLDMLYLIDNGAELSIPWDTSQGYLNCFPLLRELEEWGCLRTLRKGLADHSIETIAEKMSDSVLATSTQLVKELASCKSVIDGEKISARAKKLWLER